MTATEAEGAGSAARSAADVARYYDSNTRRFLSFGGGGRRFAIHRQLWGPGVETVAEAAGFVNELIATSITDHAGAEARAIADFGCGVGGTLFDLAGRLPQADLFGVTISPRQVTMARALSRRLGVADRCRFEQGDFESITLRRPVDAIVAVEAFAHSVDPDRFFANAVRNLRRGGLLVLVDDFVAIDSGSLSDRQRVCVRDFAQGWRLGSLATAETCVARVSVQRA